MISYWADMHDVHTHAGEAVKYVVPPCPHQAEAHDVCHTNYHVKYDEAFQQVRLTVRLTVPLAVPLTVPLCVP